MKMEFSKNLYGIPPEHGEGPGHKAKEKHESGADTLEAWKERIDGAVTIQDYIREVQSSPVGLDPDAVGAIFFGDGGVIGSIQNKGALPMKEHTYSYKDPDYDIAEYIDENGFESAVHLAMAHSVETVTFISEKQKDAFVRLIKNLLREEHALLLRNVEVRKQEEEEQVGDAEIIHEEESALWNDDELFLGSEENVFFEQGISQINFVLQAVGKNKIEGLEHEILDATMDIFPGAFTRQVAHVFSEGDSGRAAEVLLQRIRGNERSDMEREAVGRVLYLLELGKIGVKENVVTYLEKQYELSQKGEEKIDVARRITSDGKIGLFDEHGALVGFFDLGNLAADDQRRQAEVLEISRDMLFANPETPDEIRQQFLADYTDFYEKIFGEIGGVRMSDLSLREQVWMYKFWNDNDDETWAQVKGIQKEFGFAGIQTFIAGEYDAAIGKKIIAFAEAKDISDEKKRGVFDRFGRLVDALDNAELFVSKYVKDRTVGDASRVTAEIAKRAARMLADYLTSNDEQTLDAKMLGMREDLLLFAASFKALLHGKEITDFAEIQGMDFEMVGPFVLSDKDKQEMRAIMEKNNRDETGNLRPFAQAVVLPGLEKAFSDESNRFFVLRQENHVIAYFRMQDRESDVYFGSFNVDAGAIGSGLGTVLMEKRFAKEAAGRKITANVEAMNPAAGAYVNQHDFVITEFLPDVAGTGTNGFTITRDENNKNAYVSRQQGVAPFDSERVITESFDLTREAGRFESVMQDRVNSGEYVVTRYDIDPKTGACECTLEKVQQAVHSVSAAA